MGLFHGFCLEVRFVELANPRNSSTSQVKRCVHQYSLLVASLVKRLTGTTDCNRFHNELI
jgi:hypothetical protein